MAFDTALNSAPISSMAVARLAAAKTRISWDSESECEQASKMKARAKMAAHLEGNRGAIIPPMPSRFRQRESATLLTPFWLGIIGAKRCSGNSVAGRVDRVVSRE